MTNLIMMEVIIMGCTIAQKIIKAHLVSGEMKVGNDIGLRIDQTLTQDATGTMAYIEYEAMGIPRVKTEKSVAYIDHNTLQTGFENADDHRSTPYRRASRMRTTTDLFSRSARSTAFIFHVPATVSAIRCILSASASPARP